MRAPVAVGLTPHLRCAGAILTLRDGERFHYESDAYIYMSTRQNPAPVIQPRDSTTSWSTSLAHL